MLWFANVVSFCGGQQLHQISANRTITSHLSPQTTSHLKSHLTSNHISHQATSHLKSHLTSNHLSPQTTSHLKSHLTSKHMSPQITSHLKPPLTSNHLSSQATSHLKSPLTSHLKPTKQKWFIVRKPPNNRKFAMLTRHCFWIFFLLTYRKHFYDLTISQKREVIK